jgi:predicted RecA/RadA family phage recombinase
MAVINQLAGTFLLDLPVHNYGGSTLAEGVAVIADTANPPGSNTAGGVVLPASDVAAIGFLTSAIPAGKSGTMRVQGVAVANPTVGATIAFGAPVMTDSTGSVLTQTAGKYQIGYAWSAVTTAVSGDKVLVLIDRAKNA